MVAITAGVVGADDPVVDELVKMGKRYSRTLGMMPAGAFKEAAYRGCLIAAWDGGRPVGYALFRLPRNNQVMLSHLCVETAARGSGVARVLVETIKNRHAAQLGIRAKCRDDYGLNPMWSALGFQALGAAVGRGRDRSPMTVWWLDHGHPNLFSALTEPDLAEDEPDLLEAALDLNILMDLHSRSNKPVAERSQVLLADHLTGRLRLVVTDGVEHELARRCHDQPTALTEALREYPRRVGAPAQTEALYEQLVAASNGLTLSEQDLGDLRQIAAVVSAGVGVLLTWDDGLRARFEKLRRVVPALAPVHVLNPDLVVTHLDELARAWAYQPARLQNSEYDQVRAGADDESHLLAFLAQPSGETRGNLRDLLRRLAREEVPRFLIRSGDQPPVACYAAHLDGQILRVPLLRTGNHPLSDTVARQLLWLLRRDAREHGALTIEVSDPHVGGVLTRALAAEPFHHVGDRWFAWVVPVCGTSEEVNRVANQARALVRVGPGPLMRPGLTPRAAVEVERSLWPAKLTDSTLQHFVLPIRPRWSGELLGYPAHLTTRPVELALGRAQVYYRTADKLLTAPARIVWRASQGKGGRSAPGYIGTSFLDAIEVDEPERLYESLKHYGVLDLAALRELADGKPTLQALRFSDTELFDRPVSESSYQRLRAAHDGPRKFYGPQKISPGLFADLYKAATM
ncbi:GNAT family N-acetyltransferase [Actinokineospora sp. NPDC004072]